MPRAAVRLAAAVVVIVVLVTVVVTVTQRLGLADRDESVGYDDGVVYHRVTAGGNAYVVVDVDLTRATLRHFWQGPDGARYGSLGNVRSMVEANGDRLVFATNGGIFDPGHRPAGLYVEDGIDRVPLNRNDGVGNFYLKPNGVFFVGPDGAAVVDASAYPTTRQQPALAL